MRIKVIDGLRTVAVLGVLWAHIWMFQGNQSFSLAGIDIARLMSFFGTGVDLFFVISGFCMYLMYIRKDVVITSSYYIDYLKKRWIRIAPVYYIAILVYAFIAAGLSLNNLNAGEILKHMLFIRNFYADPSYAPHFWSLCVEWHFYMVLPFILICLQKLTFKKAMGLLVLTCMIIRVFIWKNQSNPDHLVNFTLANRLVEFLMGIIAAKLFNDKTYNSFFDSKSSLIVGILIAFTGRILMTGGIALRTDLLGVTAKVINLPLLVIGYSMVMLNVLYHKSVVTSMLESKLFTSIGKYSYSMYLWHWIIAQHLSDFMEDNLSLSSFLLVNLTFIVAVLILYPLSWLSYSWFESFYFNKQKSLKLAMSKQVAS